jgi:hypothetical protein
MHGQSYYRSKRYAIYGAETTALLSRHIQRPAIFDFKIIIKDKDLGPFAYSEGFDGKVSNDSIEHGKSAGPPISPAEGYLLVKVSSCHTQLFSTESPPIDQVWRRRTRQPC